MRAAPVVQLRDRAINLNRRKMSLRDRYVLQIRGSYTEAIAAVFQVGSTLIDAKEQLPKGEFAAMVENDLPFGVRTAQMFMAIARNEVLANANHDSLPVDWNALYLATRLPEEVLQAKIESGEFGPDTRRRHLQRWLHDERARREGFRPLFSDELLPPAPSREEVGYTAREQVVCSLRNLARDYLKAANELEPDDPEALVWSRAAERVLALAADLECEALLAGTA